MRYTHSRIGCVYALSAVSRCTENINSYIIHIKVYINLICLRKNCNRYR